MCCLWFSHFYFLFYQEQSLVCLYGDREHNLVLGPSCADTNDISLNVLLYTMESSISVHVLHMAVTLMFVFLVLWGGSREQGKRDCRQLDRDRQRPTAHTSLGRHLPHHLRRPHRTVLHPHWPHHQWGIAYCGQGEVGIPQLLNNGRTPRFRDKQIDPIIPLTKTHTAWSCLWYQMI